MRELKVYEEVLFPSCPLSCHVIPMGEDYTVTVSGGTRPHVGCVVMAQARPSLSGEGVSATSSVLCRVGHKDEEIARRFAESVAIRGNCTAVCSCGIHVEAITEEQLAAVREGCGRLLRRVLAELGN